MGFRSLRVMNERLVWHQARGLGPTRIKTWKSSRTYWRELCSIKTRWETARFCDPVNSRGCRPEPVLLTVNSILPLEEPVHLYQIWLIPDKKGLEPSYEQKRFPVAEQKDRLRLVASPDAADGLKAIAPGRTGFPVADHRMENQVEHPSQAPDRVMPGYKF